MAFGRRSPALALIAIGFAAQWVSWARIDRAAFQYHYYTALPFVILALAYLVAELWNGPSRRTWLAVRLAGAAAIMAPAALWLFSRPLCGLVGVETRESGLAGLSGGHPGAGADASGRRGCSGSWSSGRSCSAEGC